MIKSFGDKHTADLFHTRPSRHARRFPPTVVGNALRKLDIIEAARSLKDLKVIPGNRFEPLRGELLGYYSIRVNNQWRIVFQWSGNHAYDVSLKDYH